MPYPGSNFCITLACTAVLISFTSAACGNGCFVAFSNNGNGGVLITAGNPPPPCSLMLTHAAIRVVALKSPSCEFCTNAARPEHMFLTVRSIQLRTADGSNSEEWREIAPQFANEPGQIDLVGSTPDVLLENATVPAGSYRQLRLQLLSDVRQDAENLPGQNPCQQANRSCIVKADGRVAPVHQAELSMPLQTPDGSPLFLLPDSRLELRITVAAAPSALNFSNPNAGTLSTLLVGEATATRDH